MSFLKMHSNHMIIYLIILWLYYPSWQFYIQCLHIYNHGEHAILNLALLMPLSCKWLPLLVIIIPHHTGLTPEHQSMFFSPRPWVAQVWVKALPEMFLEQLCPVGKPPILCGWWTHDLWLESCSEYERCSRWQTLLTK